METKMELNPFLTSQEQEKFPKLPTWAKNKINVLLRRIEDLLVLLNVENKSTRIWIQNFNKEKKFLSERERIIFQVPNGQISVYLKSNGSLNINSQYGEGLAVLPGGGVNDIDIMIRARNSEKTGPEYTIGDKNFNKD